MRYTNGLPLGSLFSAAYNYAMALNLLITSEKKNFANEWVFSKPLALYIFSLIWLNTLGARTTRQIQHRYGTF